MSYRNSYYDDDDRDDFELDVRVGRGRSPHHRQPEPRYYAPPRPVYVHGPGYLEPNISARVHRSTSRRRRDSTPHPVNITVENHIPAPEAPRRRSPSPQPQIARDPLRSMDRAVADGISMARWGHGNEAMDFSGRYNLPGLYSDANLAKRAEERREREELADYKRQKQEAEEKVRRDMEDFKRQQADDEKERKRKKDEEFDDMKARLNRMTLGSSSYEREKRTFERLVEERRLDDENRRYDQDEAYNERFSLGARERRYREDPAVKRELEELRRAAEEGKRKEREKAIAEAAVQAESDKQLREEAKKRAEKEKLKKEHEKAVEEYKKKEEEEKAKEKKEKEKRDKEIKKLLEERLRRENYTEAEIQRIVNDKKETSSSNAIARPTYTRMSRKYLSAETLRKYHIEYDFDQDPDYFLIKRWVPESEQDFLWADTKAYRERIARENQPLRIEERETILILQNDKKKHGHGHRGETEMFLTRPKQKGRKHSHSPSPLISFIAGRK